MLQFFRHLFSDPADLRAELSKRSVRIAVAVALAIVAVVLLIALFAARTPVGTDSAMWDGVLQARLALVRLVLAVPTLLLAVLAAVTIYQTVENSDLGKRVLVEPLHRALILAALLMACIHGLLQGVLR